MKFDIVLNQVIILFIIMITGIAAAKAGVISDGTSKKLSELIIYVTNPMMVLGSFSLSIHWKSCLMVYWCL